MEGVITAISSVLGLIPTFLAVILDDPILTFLFAAGLVPVGFKLVKQAKGTAAGGTGK